MILRLPERSLHGLHYATIAIPAVPTDRADDGCVLGSVQLRQRSEQQGGEEQEGATLMV